ncbi:patatin-like phospholipase family protein [Candidatus Poribacteria bacterium]|nr:patatin-like phospholipase family protein [Candidatus Poribacteria bacterium]
MVAAGFTAAEIEYLGAPSGTRTRPTSLPAGLEPTPGVTFQDLPASAAEISQETRRNNLLYHVLKGTVIDRLQERILANLPDVSPYITNIVNQIPNNVDISSVRNNVQHFIDSLTLPDNIRSRITGIVSQIPNNVDISSVRNNIRNAIQAELNAFSNTIRQGAESITLPAQREAFADAMMDTLLDSHRFIRGFYNLLGDGGVYKGEAALNSLKQTLQRKLGGSTIRFRDLPLPLAVIASDATNQKLCVYSSKATPDMEVAEAVRRSLSVPFYFEPRQEGRADIVDGGVIENYPVWLYLITGTDNPYVSNTDVDMQRVKIAFSVDSEEPLPDGSPCPIRHHATSDNPILSLADAWAPNLIEKKFAERLLNVVETAMAGSAMGDALIKSYQRDLKLYEVRIPLEGYDWLDFDIEAPVFNGMCCRGWEAAKQVIENKRLRPEGTIMPVQRNPYSG